MTDQTPNISERKALLPEEKKGELLVKVAEHAVRFGALANAGGVFATITIIAATSKNGAIPNILAVPLALFSSGVICALLTSLGLLFDVGEVAKGQAIKADRPVMWIKPILKKHEDILLVGAPGCFILGCFIGVVFVLFA